MLRKLNEDVVFFKFVFTITSVNIIIVFITYNTMSNMKRNAKSKFLSEELEDFINVSQYAKDSPKNKKGQKRNKTETFMEEAMSKLGDNQTVAKRKKVEAVSYGNNTRQKVLETMNQQVQSR